MNGISVQGSRLNFGDVGLKATEPAWVTSRQIEAARRVLTRYTRRGGKLWIRIFPDKSVTARAAETRMGSGKGVVDHWVAVVKPGRMIFELAGVPEAEARVAMKLASAKLPMGTRVVASSETGQ